jgi:hypothetical protein
MSFLQGEALPDVTQTTKTADVAPDYYTNYLTQLSNTGQTALNKSPTDLVAGLTPMQNQGFNAVPNAANAYQPGLAAAGTTTALAGQAMSPEGVQNFMNPYTQNVVDEMGRLSQQNMQRNLMPALTSGFVGTGGLGGQRYANALGQMGADVQSNLTGQQMGALSKGYDTSLQAAYNQGNLQNTVGQQQAQQAGLAQSLGLTGANAMTKAGSEQQAYLQSLLDSQVKNASNVSGLMRGFTVPTSQTQTKVGPLPNAYGLSDLQQIAGTLGGLGALKMDALGNLKTDTLGGYVLKEGFDFLGDAGKSLYKYLTGD